MTTSKVAIVSMAGLVGLAAVILVQRHEISRLRQRVAGLQGEAGAASSATGNSGASPRGNLSTTNVAPPRFDWRHVESSDYQTYVANLRAIGCPEQTIRDIIRADVNELYDQKKKQYRQGAPKWDYWTNPQEFIRGQGREMWTKLLAFDEERDAVLRTLGIEPDQRKKAAKNLNAFDMLLDFLEDDGKKAQILRLRHGLEDRLATRPMNSLDLAGIRALEQEMEDAIRRLLTPEAAHQLRMSPTARSLVHELSAFEPTEQEYVTIFNLQKAYDDEFGDGADDGSAAARGRSQEASQRLQEQIKEALGEARYADYSLASDPSFQLMHSIVKQAGLGLAETKQIYSARQAMEQRAAGSTAEGRADAAKEWREPTTRFVESVLGERGLALLKQQGNDRAVESLMNVRVRPATGSPAP